MFIIEDDLHAEPQGEYPSFQDAIDELKRRAAIPWDERPNRAPCMSWPTCGRSYEVIEYDTAITPWKVLRRVAVLDVSASGVKWLIEFTDQAAGQVAPAGDNSQPGDTDGRPRHR